MSQETGSIGFVATSQPAAQLSQHCEAGLKVEDVDIYEINEAFASQAKMCLE